jgi:hypothetical protein
MTFEQLEFAPSHMPNGIWARKFFPNGYGASVIRSDYSYGGEAGLYEIGVLIGSEGDYCLCYETPITDDVLGYLSESDVTTTLQAIAALPPVSP